MYRSLLLIALVGCSTGAPSSDRDTESTSASTGEVAATMSPVDEGAAPPSRPARPSSSAAPGAVSPELEVAVATLKKLIVEHEDAAIQDAFALRTLDRVPVSEWKALFDRVLARAGTCTTHAVRELLSSTKVAFRFECTKSPAHVTVGVEKEPPHRINYLLIRAADPQ